jgi:Arc/MetJ-type ribon-helix-helix transcriptional regulator
MTFRLSPQNEQFLEQTVASSLFSSKEAVINLAVDAMRKEIPLVPEEHMELVEEGLRDLEENGAVEMTAADWEELRQLARDVAMGRAQSSDGR